MTPTTFLQVMGSRGRMPVKAVIDTGFNGDLCLPVSLAVGLGLELAGQREVELADGSVKLEYLFSGSVHFLGRTRNVEIYLTNSDDALVGTGLLSDCHLSIEFPTEKVRLDVCKGRTGRRPKGKS